MMKSTSGQFTTKASDASYLGQKKSSSNRGELGNDLQELVPSKPPLISGGFEESGSKLSSDAGEETEACALDYVTVEVS